MILPNCPNTTLTTNSQTPQTPPLPANNNNSMADPPQDLRSSYFVLRAGSRGGLVAAATGKVWSVPLRNGCDQDQQTWSRLNDAYDRAGGADRDDSHRVVLLFGASGSKGLHGAAEMASRIPTPPQDDAIETGDSDAVYCGEKRLRFAPPFDLRWIVLPVDAFPGMPVEGFDADGALAAARNGAQLDADLGARTLAALQESMSTFEGAERAAAEEMERVNAEKRRQEVGFFFGDADDQASVWEAFLAHLETTAGRVLYGSHVGSWSYGTAVPGSDRDMFAVVAAPPAALVRLHPPRVSLKALTEQEEDFEVHEAAAFGNALLNGTPLGWLRRGWEVWGILGVCVQPIRVVGKLWGELENQQSDSPITPRHAPTHTAPHRTNARMQVTRARLRRCSRTSDRLWPPMRPATGRS